MVLVEIEELGEMKTERYTALNDEEINKLVGQVLTQLEAAIPSGSQLDALKSLVKQTIYAVCSHGSGMAYRIVDKTIPWPEGTGATFPNREITVTDPWVEIPMVTHSVDINEE